MEEKYIFLKTKAESLFLKLKILKSISTHFKTTKIVVEYEYF